MFRNGAPTITSDRLTLGPVSDAHADAFMDVCATDAARFPGGPRDREYASAGIAMQAGQWTLRGYAAEAALAARNRARDTLGLGPPRSLIDPASTPSERVAPRLGARNEGPHRTDVFRIVNRWRPPGREARA
ncbi:MAG: hypothetical protein KDE03_12810 [Rhodobacteraceae bacterium]|nr:hypothetical protein [Paracoccaceae bacterium]